MQIIRGRFSEAVIFSDQLDKTALDQIKGLCDHEASQGSRIRIMPDAHAGAGCTIGTTMTVVDKVVPNLVGVDIGCGMLTHRLAEAAVDFARLDEAVRKHVPSGFAIRQKPHEYLAKVSLEKLKCWPTVNQERARLSVGTLGGGNHFIELASDERGVLYLVIHSGSRNLGKQIAEHYQKKAIQAQENKNRSSRDLAWLEGSALQDYLHDMQIAVHYAETNRQAIAREILSHLGLTSTGHFTTIHNYIDPHAMILRKGAIAATRGEQVLIPLNMRDGSLIAVGKGNPDWNFSAPHGAGRLLSRKQALQTLSMREFEDAMRGIYTSTLSRQTLDEAPAAYKPKEEILELIRDTVEIVDWLRPLYNFKSTGD